MRITAWILIVFAVWWLGVWWNDPVEGRLMRPFAVAVGIAGCLLYVRGVRNEASRSGREFRLRQLLRFNLLGMLFLVMLVGIGLAMFLPGVQHGSVSTTGCSYDYEIHPFDDNRLTQLVFFNGITSRRRCRSNTKWYAEVHPFDNHRVSIVYEGTVTRDHQIWEARNGTFVPSDEQVTFEELSAFMESTKSNVRERTLENLLTYRDLHRRVDGQQN